MDWYQIDVAQRSEPRTVFGFVQRFDSIIACALHFCFHRILALSNMNQMSRKEVRSVLPSICRLRSRGECTVHISMV
jgi:hypothetical protein